jgi:ATP-binding cassette, subfamily C, bacterial LapB
MAAVLRIAAHYRIAVSPEQIRLDLAWSGERDQLQRLARSAGLLIAETEAKAGAVSGLRLPLLVEFDDGQIGVIETETEAGFAIALSEDKGLVTQISPDRLMQRLRRVYVLRPAAAVADRRIDEYIAPYRPDWLRSIALADLGPYRAVMLASLVTNVLALGGILFSMQVYDRVVPSQSMSTLNVLFGGVMIATFFGLLMKISRSRITDAAGKAADLRISDRVFGHALRVRNTARPRATGTFISQIRELEHVREIMTSTTVTAMADMPFFLMFSALFFYIAGPLVWIPLVAVVLLIAPGLLVQKRLRQLAEASSRESSLRGAMLVETIQGLDDIKSLQAEGRFQNLWNHYNEVTSGASIELRDLVNRLSSWAQTVQGAVFALVIYFGAPMVMAGEMSTGVLVAASMLSSRMLAPLASVTQLINRWQQARVARDALDKLMALPVDTPAEARSIHKPLLHGHFKLSGAVFGHTPKTPVLAVAALEIKPGERVAILGRNGAGKSTLLSGLSGLLEPIAGDIRVDGITMGLLDSADLRRDIGYMGQNARLFHGTLRENLALGAPMASDQEMIAQLDKLALAEFVQKLPEGLDHQIQEGGLGLSGGQRQGLLIARLMLRHPRVLLLDEPTATLDEVSENTAINTLGALSKETTLIVATHRPAVLRIVDRLIVVNNGAIAMDGPKDKVLADLRAGKSPT